MGSPLSVLPQCPETTDDPWHRGPQPVAKPCAWKGLGEEEGLSHSFPEPSEFPSFTIKPKMADARMRESRRTQ